MLEAGEHTIEFHYRTPNCFMSAAMTASGIALAFAAGVIYRAVNKKRKEKPAEDAASTDDEN